MRILKLIYRSLPNRSEISQNSFEIVSWARVTESQWTWCWSVSGELLAGNSAICSPLECKHNCFVNFSLLLTVWQEIKEIQFGPVCDWPGIFDIEYCTAQVPNYSTNVPNWCRSEWYLCVVINSNATANLWQTMQHKVGQLVVFLWLPALFLLYFSFHVSCSLNGESAFSWKVFKFLVAGHGCWCLCMAEYACWLNLSLCWKQTVDTCRDSVLLSPNLIVAVQTNLQRHCLVKGRRMIKRLEIFLCERMRASRCRVDAYYKTGMFDIAVVRACGYGLLKSIVRTWRIIYTLHESGRYPLGLAGYHSFLALLKEKGATLS